ncbi:MAG: hypothetical protein ABI988_09270 [Nitrospirota bacterium]
MASVLGRAPSKVSRESACHPTRGHPSRASTAHTVATARAHQPRRPRRLMDPWRLQSVKTPLTEGCSPEQIAGRCPTTDAIARNEWPWARPRLRVSRPSALLCQ